MTAVGCQPWLLWPRWRLVVLVTVRSQSAMMRDGRCLALGSGGGIARGRPTEGPVRHRPAEFDHPEVSIGYLKTEGGGFGKEATAC